MTEPPVDFSSLEPGGGRDYWERLALRVEAAAAGELARRAEAARGPRPLLVRRWAPILAAAATVAVVAGAALFRSGPRLDPAAALVTDLAGVPYETAVVMMESEPPSWPSLLLNAEGGR